MSVNPFMDDNNEEMEMDFAEEEAAEEQPEEESGNRTFIIIAAVMGLIMLLILGCIAVIAWQSLGPSRDAQQTQVAAVTATDQAQKTIVAFGVEQTSAAATQKAIPTKTPVPPSPTPAPTNTSVVARPAGPTATQLGAVDPRTATVAALFTQAAEAQKTVIATSTALPDSGFADDVGLPGLVGLAVALVVVVFLARRLRLAS